MKRKEDFVTNSSSCSFIFIGWTLETAGRIKEIVKEQMETFGNVKYDDTMEPIENIYEAYDGKVSIEIGTGENGLDEDKVYVGIHSTISDDGDVKEYTIEELLKLDDKLEECFDPRDIKIIAGEASC